jgi:hypothetical protein
MWVLECHHCSSLLSKGKGGLEAQDTPTAATQHLLCSWTYPPLHRPPAFQNKAAKVYLGKVICSKSQHCSAPGAQMLPCKSFSPSRWRAFDELCTSHLCAFPAHRWQCFPNGASPSPLMPFFSSHFITGICHADRNWGQSTRILWDHLVNGNDLATSKRIFCQYSGHEEPSKVLSLVLTNIWYLNVSDTFLRTFHILTHLIVVIVWFLNVP